MTLQTFMFAADALRLEDGVGFHMETVPGAAPVPSPADVKAQNAQSMAMLTGMLAGVKKK
jgi:hypothetical protein